jgi:hypothetical protein
MTEIKLIGSKFTKVIAERKPEFSGKLSMDQNIKIVDIDKAKDTKDTIKVSYNFTVDYKELGKVEVEGVLFISGDQKTIKILLKQWKDKTLDTPEYIAITNVIIQKASIKAIELEEEMGLPIHFRLPTLAPKKEEKK